MGSLSAGETKTDSLFFNIPTSYDPGVYYLTAIADVFSFVSESNESNNEYYFSANPITITAAPVDLYPNSATINNAAGNYKENSPISVNAYIGNSGGIDANNAPYVLTLYTGRPCQDSFFFKMRDSVDK
jgi:subtilase family serine protease